MNTLEFTVMDVNPFIAEGWLKTNTNNRPLSDSRVVNYANQMKRGEWQLNGEPIIFAQNGALLNGQHRLQAVIKSKTTVKMSVVKNAPNDSFATIDTGKGRSGSDFWALKGLDTRSARIATTALGWLFRYDTSAVLSNTAPSNQQMEDLYHDNIKLWDSISFVKKQKDNKEGINLTTLLPPGLGAFLHYKICQVDKAKGEEFFQALISGENLAASNPAKLLRDRLQRYRFERSKRDQKEICGLVMLAWSYYKASISVERLKTPSNLAEAPSF